MCRLGWRQPCSKNQDGHDYNACFFFNFSSPTRLSNSRFLYKWRRIRCLNVRIHYGFINRLAFVRSVVGLRLQTLTSSLCLKKPWLSFVLNRWSVHWNLVSDIRIWLGSIFTVCVTLLSYFPKFFVITIITVNPFHKCFIVSPLWFRSLDQNDLPRYCAISRNKLNIANSVAHYFTTETANCC